MSKSKELSTIQNFGLGKSILICALAFIVKRTLDAGDPIHYIIPNMLLFTPFVDTTHALWKYLKPIKRAPKDFKRHHIPIIQAKDFTPEELYRVTDRYRIPAMVKGLFKDTPAVKGWSSGERLNEKLGDFSLPYIRKADFGAHQGTGNRAVDSFYNISTDILTNASSRHYLFFPVKSRFQYKGSDAGAFEGLVQATNEIVHDDLELEKHIYKGFGTKEDKLFRGSQIIMGNGAKNLNETTGTLWHCALGSNWFIQVVGKKRWYFMDQQYSSLMSPLKGGTFNIQVGSKKTQAEAMENAPYKWADLEAGDMLYNPDYSWHAIQNYEGLSIGCPIRVKSLKYALRNNLQYSILSIYNLIMLKIGVDVGGYAEQRHLD